MFLITIFLTVIGPRVGLAFIWLFSNWVDRSIESTMLAVLGFAFLPWTTLAYVVMWSAGGLSLLGWMVVGFCAIFDLGSYGGTAFSRGR